MHPIFYIIIAILATTILYLLICLYVFKSAFGRKKEIDLDDKEALKKTFYKDLIDEIDKARKFVKESGAQTFFFTSFDGLKLEGTFIPCKNARGTIVLAHGYQGNAISDFGIVLQLYQKQGLNVLTFRQRSHGNSQGKYVTFGTLEHKDLISLIEYHNANLGDFPIILSGISMGASTVLYAICSPNLPSNVKGATADCGFTSGYEIVKKVVNETLRFNASFLMFGVNFWCKLIAKFDAKSCSSEKLLKDCKIPVVFVHGEKDELVPVQMTIKSYEACASEKQLVLVKDAGHGTSYLLEPERLSQVLNDFFNKVLEN